LRVAHILQDLGPEILIELEDLQLDFADLAPRARGLGDDLAVLALQPRLVALEQRVA
jgi:hypothetical protein